MIYNTNTYLSTLMSMYKQVNIGEKNPRKKDTQKQILFCFVTLFLFLIYYKSIILLLYIRYNIQNFNCFNT